MKGLPAGVGSQLLSAVPAGSSGAKVRVIDPSVVDCERGSAADGVAPAGLGTSM